jgi:glutaredoxin 3
MSTWEFDTTTGAGSEVVTVVYEYENDGETTYNENIKEVWFEGRDVIGGCHAFPTSQAELQIRGCMNITIYTKSGCPNCVTAKNLLQSLNLNYKEIDIETGDRFANFVANYPEARQMPQIWIGDQRVGGLAGLQAALKKLGMT